MSNKNDQQDEIINATDSTLTLDPDEETREPPLYVVIMHNDDYTPMDFVIEVLQDIFKKNSKDAENIMLNVHRQGACICGRYPRDIAETKSNLSNNRAQLNGHPLKCTFEKETE